jgi:hypothetical protein
MYSVSFVETELFEQGWDRADGDRKYRAPLRNRRSSQELLLAYVIVGGPVLLLEPVFVVVELINFECCEDVEVWKDRLQGTASQNSITETEDTLVAGSRGCQFSPQGGINRGLVFSLL